MNDRFRNPKIPSNIFSVNLAQARRHVSVPDPYRRKDSVFKCNPNLAPQKFNGEVFRIRPPWIIFAYLDVKSQICFVS